jgi:hypothetical protein
MYEGHDHLLLLWTGIWMHHHTITTTNIHQDLGKLDEILDHGHCANDATTLWLRL